MSLLFVAIGGVIGAILRYIINLLILPLHAFPLATLLINWSGCLFLGWFLTKTQVRLKLSSNIKLGIGTGITGAFTTFSTFSVDTVQLIVNQHFLLAVSYLCASVLGGLLFAWLGFCIARLGKADLVVDN